MNDIVIEEFISYLI